MAKLHTLKSRWAYPRRRAEKQTEKTKEPFICSVLYSDAYVMRMQREVLKYQRNEEEQALHMKNTPRQSLQPQQIITVKTVCTHLCVCMCAHVHLQMLTRTNKPSM